MEDALISPEGISILSGAGLIDASKEPIYVHTTENIQIGDILSVTTAGVVSTTAEKSFTLSRTPYIEKGFGVYMMIKDENGNIVSEPFSNLSTDTKGRLKVEGTKVTIEAASIAIPELVADDTTAKDISLYSAYFDYYVENKALGTLMVDITPDKFAGQFYIEGSTLFKDESTGNDHAAEIIIPNGKIQSNFSFTFSGSGDPSTFTFTVDALRGKIKGSDHYSLAAIQIIPENGNEEPKRDTTDHVEPKN